MTAEINICVVCAWRATCQKKFSVSGKDIKCADFVRDVSIQDKKNSEKAGEPDSDEN